MAHGNLGEILAQNSTFQARANKAIVESHDPDIPGSFEQSLDQIENVAAVVTACNRLGIVASQVIDSHHQPTLPEV